MFGYEVIDGSSPMNQYRKVVRKTHGLAHNESLLWGEDLSSKERDS